MSKLTETAELLDRLPEDSKQAIAALIEKTMMLILCSKPCERRALK